MSILDQLVANYAGGLQQSTQIAMNRLNQPTAADLFLQNLRKKQQMDLDNEKLALAQQEAAQQAAYQNDQIQTNRAKALSDFMGMNKAGMMTEEEALPVLQGMPWLKPEQVTSLAQSAGSNLALRKQQEERRRIESETRNENLGEKTITERAMREPRVAGAEAAARLTGSKADISEINEESQAELRRAQIDYWRKRTQATGSGGGSGGGEGSLMLDPESMQRFVADIRKNPSLMNLVPSRDKKMRAYVLNEVYKGDGTPDLASSGASYKANQSAMQQLVKSSDMVAAFEETAKKNAAVLRSRLGGMIDTGSPLINQPLAALRRNTGSREAQAILTALEPVRQEYGKILSGSVGSVAGLPVTQLEHMRKILDERMTLGQVLDTLDILENDAKNRHDAYTEKIREVARRMSSAPEVGATPQPTGAGSFSNIGANPRHPKAGWSETGVNGQPKGWYVRTSQGFMRVE